jgi:hypothetical protein
MFKKLLRKLFGMEPKEFTFAKVGTGPNQAPPPQIKKPIVKPSGQGTGTFSGAVGYDSYSYGQHEIFQDDIQPPAKIPKRTYNRDASGKFSKKPSEKIEQKSKKIKKEPPPKPVLKRPEVCKVFESHLPFGL